MHTLSIRIDDKTYDEIEKRRGDVSKSDYYRNIIDYYLKQFDKGDDKLITKYEKEIEYLRSENTKLLELLNQSQILQLQAQKRIEEPVRKWWKFWKK